MFRWLRIERRSSRAGEGIGGQSEWVPETREFQSFSAVDEFEGRR